MSTVDIIILVCFIPGVIEGLTKGFINQVVSLLALIIGVWVAFHFSELLCPYIAHYIPGIPPTVLHVTSFIVVFFVVAVILTLSGKFLSAIVKLALLGWVDKLLGVTFALLKSAIVIGLILILFNSLNTAFHFVSDETLGESVLFSPVKNFTYNLFPFLKALIFKQ